jgi:hypothetical protein
MLVDLFIYNIVVVEIRGRLAGVADSWVKHVSTPHCALHIQYSIPEIKSVAKPCALIDVDLPSLSGCILCEPKRLTPLDPMDWASSMTS